MIFWVEVPRLSRPNLRWMAWRCDLRRQYKASSADILGQIRVAGHQFIRCCVQQWPKHSFSLVRLHPSSDRYLGPD